MSPHDFRADLIVKNMQTKIRKRYFTNGEIILWSTSVIMLVLSFIIFQGENYLTLIASVLGVTSLIFCAKGNPIGQFLMIIFSSFYGFISYTARYYGEMMTYLGMTLPMAIFVFVSWLRHPFKGKRSEVEVYHVKKKDLFLMAVLAVLVTVVFYFILKYFNTANLIPSTVSVATSFIAVYLTFLRSPYHALGYAVNDVVLIVLWVLASLSDASYISVVVCFVVFLVNDLYGFINWKRMERRQKND